MAETPIKPGADVVKSALPQSTARTVENPVFRMMGLPRFKFKLPSRNWLIFLSITGSFTTTLLYDRYHRKKAQRRWCNLVSGLAQEPLPTNTMPRRITIFLSAPPGDGLRAAREHFHEYIKPILVAGALDWEVIEGRREGEVRAGLAEKIRKSRRRNGESASLEPVKESEAELLEQARLKSGIKEWDGVQGDLVLGRHTWKEYIRGLHEGWLGPLDPPSLPETATETPLEPSVVEPIEASTPESPAVSNKTLEEPATPPPPPAPPPKPPKPSSPPPPHISPPSYPTSPLSVSTPESLPPSVLLPFPHLLGFLNTPTRVYRFLTRRHLADDTGASVAALVLAINSRPYRSTAAFASAADPDSAISAIADEEMLIAEGKRSWEQEEMLLQEEKEWHKSAWKEDEPGQERERVWKEKMILDARIGERMSLFELAEGERDRAIREEKRRETEKASWGWVREVKDWIGWRDKEETKGWEMGLVSQDGD